MNGGFLSKIFSKIAGNSGDDLLRSVATKYGSDIASNVASNYGDDAAKAVLSRLTNPVATAEPTMNAAAQEFASTASNFGKQNMGSRIKKAASMGADDAFIRKFGTSLSNDTIKKLRTVSPRYTDKTFAKILEEDGVNPHNIEQYSKVAKRVGELRDSVIDSSDKIGNSARGKEVLGIFQNAYDTTNFGKSTFKKVGKDYAQNYLKELSGSLDDRGNIPLATLRQTSTRLQSKANDLRSLADKGGANAEENLAMSDYLKKIQTGIDDHIDAVTENSVNGAELQKQTLEILQGAGVHPNTLKRISEMNPEEFKLSTVKGIMAPYVFAGNDMMGDISRAKPTAGGNIWGIPGTEPLGNAMKSGANNAVYSLNRVISGEGGQGLKKTAKIAGAGLGGLAVLSSLTGGNAVPVNTQGADATGSDGTTAKSGTAKTTTTTKEATIAGYTRDQLENAYVAALTDNNGEAADRFGKMIDMLDNKEAAAKSASSASGKSTTAKATNATNAIKSLMSMYNAGGGAQGGIGALSGLLNKATFGAVNPTQAAYEDQLQATAVAVARAYGEVGVLSDQDIENYKKLLPTFSDNPKQAQLKIERVIGDLQNMESQ